MDKQSEESGSAQPVTTVSKSVLGAFFEDLGKIEGFEDIAANLKRVVIDDGVFAEPSIRAAIFPEV